MGPPGVTRRQRGSSMNGGQMQGWGKKARGSRGGKVLREEKG